MDERRIVTRAWWQGMASDEDSRALLQSRLIVLSRLMFWSFVALLGAMFALYQRYPEKAPDRNTTIYAIGAVGIVALVILWRGLLLRRALPMRALYAIDTFYGTSSGTIFAAAAALAPELHMAETANILWTCFVVFLRTIVVPSTGTRTAIVGSCTFAPIVLAAVALSQTPNQEFPGPALIGSALLVGTLVVLLATSGSKIIYDLRLQANAAQRLGQYTLDRKIGEGGNGAVYRAHHALLRRPTAVKLVRPDRLEPETLDRFEREVQHMSQLTHPNTVAVFDYGRSPDGVFYYAMEYLDGIDLEKLVAGYGAQPADRVIAILVQVCGALGEAHRRGIIHRDIKPANIILCERGDIPDVAKVVDFGLVKEVAGDKAKSGHGILATPAYVAPEVVTDPERVGPAADLYALGAVGYFLLTGERVFKGKTSVDIAVQHVTAAPVPPSQIKPTIPPELEAIVMRCLAKQPDERPASADELARLLREVPAGNAWTEADARRWWSEFTAAAPKIDAGPALTITVDLKRDDRLAS